MATCHVPMFGDLLPFGKFRILTENAELLASTGELGGAPSAE